jgi:predicted metalloendopeptidase
MSWATIWRSKARDEATKNQVKQIHIPRNVPCLCTIAKCGYLYQAFGIQVNDGMYIAQRKELKSGNKKYFIKKIPS